MQSHKQTCKGLNSHLPAPSEVCTRTLHLPQITLNACGMWFTASFSLTLQLFHNKPAQ